jgi:hypothetical protein
MKSSRSESRVSFPLRIPVELRAYLERAARDAHRSLNGEIVFRLERSVRAELAETSSAPAGPAGEAR